MLVALLIIAYIYGAAILTSSIEDVKTAQIAFAAAIGIPSLVFMAIGVYVIITDLVIPFVQAI